MRYALNTNGDITMCNATPENLGKGRCNHILHQEDGESVNEFLKKCSEMSKEKETELPSKFYAVDEEDKIHKCDGYVSRSDDSIPKINGVCDKFYNPNTKEFLKLDFDELNGKEGLREDFISTALEYTDIKSYVKYESKIIETKDGWKACTKSKDFKPKNCRELTYETIMTLKGVENTKEVIDVDEAEMLKQIQTLNEIGGKDFTNELVKIWAMDIITMNYDRVMNYGNFGLLANEKTGEFELMPMFDNGSSLPEDEIDIYNEESFKETCNRFKKFTESIGFKGNILKINYDGLKECVNNYDNLVYQPNEINYMLKLFSMNIKNSKGILWN